MTAPASAAAPARAPAIEPAWLTLARTQLGIHEGVGAANNPRVLGYYADAAHPEIRGDDVAWCAAFVGAMLKRSGIKPSGSLAARSYEAWGQPLAKPVLGCVGVKKRPGGGWLGHVGFVVGASAAQIILLAGNQGDAVSIAAFPRAQFTAFRWPANLAIPRDLSKLPTSLADARTNVSEA